MLLIECWISFLFDWTWMVCLNSVSKYTFLVLFFNKNQWKDINLNKYFVELFLITMPQIWRDKPGRLPSLLHLKGLVDFLVYGQHKPVGTCNHKKSELGCKETVQEGKKALKKKKPVPFRRIFTCALLLI